MAHGWEELDDEVAAGSSCPKPDCGLEFVVPEDELVLQSVPKGWLLAGIHLA